MRHISSGASRGFALLVLGGAAIAPSTASAHNGAIHRAMTETAYDVIVAAEAYHDKKPLPEELLKVFTLATKDPAMSAFVDALAASGPKLRAIPAGLISPYSWECYDPVFIDKTGSKIATWSPDPTIAHANIPMGQLRYAVSNDYITGTDCGVDVGWDPGVVWKGLLGNADFFNGDHTGTALGFWSVGPDNAMDDIHMTLRPSNALGLSYIKKWIETIGGAAAATVWIPIKCAFKCAEAILTFGLAGSCKKCLEDAVNDAKSASHEAVSEIDGLLPMVGDITNANFTGIPHHVNPPGPKPFVGPWSVPNDSYDDQWGLLVDRAGPNSVPDPIEIVAIAASDITGLSFRAEKCDAIQNYQIGTNADGHPATVHRDTEDWQYLSWPHVAMTPVDNLGMFGWMETEGYAHKGAFQASLPLDPTKLAYRLGWSLHAIGDATVPMHTTGTFGWGHRPFEDSMQNLTTALFRRDSIALTARMVDTLLKRAFEWRKIVLAWRAAHPGEPDLPMRDLVSGVAAQTMARIPLSGFDVFNPYASTQYLYDKHAANLIYDSGPIDLYQDLIDAGTSAEITVLASAMELLP